MALVNSTRAKVSGQKTLQAGAYNDFFSFQRLLSFFAAAGDDDDDGSTRGGRCHRFVKLKLVHIPKMAESARTH
jgi:hypothetical protein